jgi:hypothetical protein
MAEQNFRVQFLRGTTAENAAFLGREGEITVDNTAHTLRLHDGVTTGGYALAKSSEVVALQTTVAAKADTATVTTKAPLASPAFTGTPVAPTAETSNSSTQLATTAFVHSAVAAVPTGSGTTQSLTISVTNWASGAWTLPSGVTVVKEYSDSAIRITHTKNGYPSGWFGFNRESSPSTPMTAMVPTVTRNMQIVDTSTVIITNMSIFNVFDITLLFN